LPGATKHVIIVQPEARGRGVTTELYSVLFTAYESRNIFTRTWSSNLAHIKILERFGFSVIGFEMVPGKLWGWVDLDPQSLPGIQQFDQNTGFLPPGAKICGLNGLGNGDRPSIDQDSGNTLSGNVVLVPCFYKGRDLILGPITLLGI
jgi:hypothetical protein